MPSNFTTLETILSDDGAVEGTITYRTDDRGRKLFSFSIARPITVDGDGGPVRKRTTWLHRRHIAALRTLLDTIENRLEVEENQARAFNPVRVRR